MTITDRRGNIVGAEDIETADWQEVTTSSDTIESTVSLVIINRSAPSTTALTLPDADARNGQILRIIDYSQSVTAHTITLTPASVAQTIMRQATWTLYSNAASLAAITLRPIEDPDDSTNTVWAYAP